jgi:hypothetical protein
VRLDQAPRLAVAFALFASTAFFSPHATAASAKFAFIITGLEKYPTADQKNVLRATLPERGYETTTFSQTPTAEKPGYGTRILDTIKGRISQMHPEDQVLISLQCHGANPTGDEADTHSWKAHYCCLTENETHCSQKITAEELVTLADVARDKKVKLAVMDASCTGGATVLGFEEKAPEVCAIANTTSVQVAQANLPRFGQHLLDHDIRSLEDLALRGQVELLKEYPQIVHQRVYESGCAQPAMRLRSDLSSAGGSLRGWNLNGTALFGILNPGKADPSSSKKSYAELASESCRLAKNLETDFAVIMENIGTRADDQILEKEFKNRFTKIMARYRAASIPIETLEPIHSLTGLRESIERGVAQSESLRTQIQESLGALNAQVTRFESSTDPVEKVRLNLEIDPLRQNSILLNRKLDEHFKAVSLLLSTYEELDCGLRPSPCRDFML